MRRILLSAFAGLFSFAANSQKISEIYSTGGNSNALFRNDFVEIFNNSSATISLNGYSIQYADAQTNSGSFTVVATLSGDLLPGQYFLIQAGGPATNPVGNTLPTPDAIGSVNFNGAAGKIILVSSSEPVPIGTNGCPNPTVGSVIDFIGYGTAGGNNGANCAEGNAPETATTQNNRSNKRNGNGCADSNNNQTDFSNNTDADPNNKSSQRFDCIAGAPLPVKFANLRAAKKGTAISVQFSNLTEEDVVAYLIERSAGGGFVEIGRLSPQKNNNTEAHYTWEDKAPQRGANLYRIKAVETSGKQVLSGVLKVDLSVTGTSLQIVPNPVRGQTLGLQVTNLPAGIYQLRIFGANAQVISSYSVQHSGGSLTQAVPLRGLQPGQYVLRLEGAVQLQQSFLVQQ